MSQVATTKPVCETCPHFKQERDHYPEGLCMYSPPPSGGTSRPRTGMSEWCARHPDLLSFSLDLDLFRHAPWWLRLQPEDFVGTSLLTDENNPRPVERDKP